MFFPVADLLQTFTSHFDLCNTSSVEIESWSLECGILVYGAEHVRVSYSGEQQNCRR